MAIVKNVVKKRSTSSSDSPITPVQNYNPPTSGTFSNTTREVSSGGADGVYSGGVLTQTVSPAYEPGAYKNVKGKNVLDAFFKGIDRLGTIQSITSTSALQGKGWNEEELLNSVGVTLDRLKAKVLNVNRININKAPSQVDFTNFGKMYAFFTKPDLNLFEDNNFSINKTIVDNNPDLMMRIIKNFPVAQTLQVSLSKNSMTGPGSGLNNLLGNLCSEISVPELQMSLEQGPKNQKDFGVSYIGDFWESLQEGDIEFSFIDTRDRDVATCLEIWMLYMEGVRNGTIFKKPRYINDNIIDSASTVFIMAVDESMNIMAHIAMVGVFPRSINTALLQYRATQLSAQDFIGPFSYTFHVSHISKPNAHHVVQMFNYVSGYEKVTKRLEGKVAHEVMYDNVGGYYHHTGITMDTGYYTDYPYHFTLYDKWAEVAGVSYNVMSSGVINYTLVFASKNFDSKPMRPEDFWKGKTSVTDIGSRWRDGAYIRRQWVNGAWRATVEGDITDGVKPSYYDPTRAYGELLNIGKFPPSSLNGVYQDSYRSWNTGANRYGYNLNIGSSKNNANTFRNVIRSLTGWGGQRNNR